MGRARSQTQATVDGFAAVFGTRRGSEAAQKQRDVDEADALQNFALRDFVAEVGSRIRGDIPATHALVASYRARLSEEEAMKALAKTRMDRRWMRGWPLEELAFIVELGDPAACPGLTTPAVAVLVSYLAAFRPNAEGSGDLYSGVGFIVSSLFASAHGEKYYRRLALLCEACAPMILDSMHGVTIRGQKGSADAAQALSVAPKVTLAGPLRSWIEAFAQRVEEGTLTAADKEYTQLKRLVAASTADSEAGIALTRLRHLLSAQQRLSQTLSQT
jgi:hypothetical protein